MVDDRTALIALLDKPVSQLAGEELREAGYIVVETGASTLGELSDAASGLVDLVIVDAAFDFDPEQVRNAISAARPPAILTVTCSLGTSIQIARRGDAEGVILVKPWVAGDFVRVCELAIEDGDLLATSE
jgi:AmiR/NasT family two-component response regulator